MKSYLVRTSLAAVIVAASPLLAQAQKGTGVGAHLTPFAGYLITGDWYDGPVGTSIAATNARFNSTPP